MSLAIYTHTSCLQHDTGKGHPESAARLDNILTTLRLSSLASQLAWEDAMPAAEEQVLLAHTPEHLSRIRAAIPQTGLAALDADTIISSASLDAALHASGAACQATDAILDGSYRMAFCATRPPGHHATANKAMGFCLFNHIAIAALHARKQGVERIAIVDFDVHHGNGTQDILLGKTGLFYLSTHQSPHYPGTGSEAENRPGNILNIPLPAGTSDRSYQEVFREDALPALHAFAPQLLLVSAGFDAHRADPLAGMALSDETYLWLGQILADVAAYHCDGKLLAVLEGGYALPVLGKSVLAFIQGLLGKTNL